MSFEFDSALVREPARSVTHGLSTQPGPRPLFDAIGREHAEYVRALEECGLAVETLPPLEDYPDSIFVEDPPSCSVTVRSYCARAPRCALEKWHRSSPS